MINQNSVFQLLNQVTTISQSYNRLAEAIGENFNLFNILRIENSEVIVHSRFIAELLDPSGSHKKGSIFLEHFIRHNISDEFEFDPKAATLKLEHSLGKISYDQITGGSIDLLIRDKHGKVIIIENKIWAGEQKNQLLRYHNKFPKAELIYLTLFGVESQQITSKNLKYTRLSYSTDILTWLETCKKEAVDNPSLRESISQYIHLIKKLTGQNIHKKMDQEIAKRITKDEGTFSAFESLQNIHHTLFLEIIENMVFPLLKEIEKKYSLSLSLDENYFLDRKKDYQGFYFSHPSLETYGIKICYQFQTKQYKELIFGLCFIKPKKNISQESKEKILLNFKTRFDKCRPETDGWLIYAPLFEFLNWSEISTLKKLQFESEFSDRLESDISSILEMVESLDSQ